MIGRPLGVTWADLRQGDVLISRLATKHWCVVIALEDAPADQTGTTRALHIFNDSTITGRAGASMIRADKGEINLNTWELIRAQNG